MVNCAILVTHDQEEAFAVSDHVGVFKEGKLEQWDTPFNLYHEPLTPFVASFIGQGYFIRGQLLSPDSVQTELGLIHGNRAYTWPTGSAVDVLLRPDDIVYDPDSAQKALIVGKTFLGAATLSPATPTTSPVSRSAFASPPITWWCSPHPAALPPKSAWGSRVCVATAATADCEQV
jgi:iron(III) transport system ATP-binding protein